MNDEESRVIRIYQYLLAKEVFLKRQIHDLEKLIYRKNPHPDDIFAYWFAKIKYECWEDFAGEVWNLLK